jgi:hypothetical protein
MSAVEPSEYVPVAVNCWVAPGIKLVGDDGVTAMEVKVVVVVDFEHAANPKVRVANRAMAKK